MTHVIVTSSDSRYGDFLVRHWGRSLKTNVDLQDIDVVVLDYGLTNTQRKGIESLGFQIKAGKRDGHVVNVRFRDTRDWLRKTSYDQVLMIDSGDIIFQSNIRHLFEKDQQQFRAACEDLLVPAFARFISTEDFEPAVFQEIYKFLECRPLINCGLVLGPREKMVALCDVCCDKTVSLHRAGVDQLLTNYHLHREGFVSLAPGYNFVLLSTRHKFKMWDGQFLDMQDRLIPVVHNAGMGTRLFRDFGFGPSCNRKDRVVAVGRIAWSLLPVRVRRYLADQRRLMRLQATANANSAAQNGVRRSPLAAHSQPLASLAKPGQ
jgi:hypothetical protein